MRFIAAVVLTLVSSSAFAECPKHDSTAGWENGKTVYYSIGDEVPAQFHAAVTDAFKEWNAANLTNGSGVKFEPLPASKLCCSNLYVATNLLPVGTAGNMVPTKADPLIEATITVDTNKFTGSDKQQVEYFMKIMLHELGHSMGLADVKPDGAVCGDNAGKTVMNQVCSGGNDTAGMIPKKPQGCDNKAVQSDPRRAPPVGGNLDPDPGCEVRANTQRCAIQEACVWVDNEPENCVSEIVCEPEEGGPQTPTCSGLLASVTKSGAPCGTWTPIPNDAQRPGDYACRNDTGPFVAPSCAQLALHSEPPACYGNPVVHTRIASIGLLCHSCAPVSPPPPPGDPGVCVPQVCPDISINCKWRPDGCGGTILCGTCLPIEPIDPGDGGGGPPPVCDGAHNEECFGSFKACSASCCGTCERRLGCGSESAHKCFEP